MKLNIVDVTFRDGGYRNNFNFDDHIIAETISYLSDAKIDFIEIGYRNGLLKKSSSIGNTAHLPDDFLSKITAYIPGKACVMVHPDNITKDDMKILHVSGVKMVRVCIVNQDIEKAIRVIHELKSFDFLVTANIIRITLLAEKDLAAIVQKLNHSEADVIYIADSNGAIVPDEIKNVFKIIKANSSACLGFHAHNNLHLALANTITAIECGVEYIDASIQGMGKGAGNLPLEILVGFLKRNGKNSQYDYIKILETSEYFKQNVSHAHMSLENKHVLMGTMNFPIDYYTHITNLAEEKGISFYQAAHIIDSINNQ
ncbi:MAG: nucleoid-structuring protein H-NS [Pedobacter sp.]|nr:MAG: nucleoid-structuring protein H-NS [Pedobacter sp.]